VAYYACYSITYYIIIEQINSYNSTFAIQKFSEYENIYNYFVALLSLTSQL